MAGSAGSWQGSHGAAWKLAGRQSGGSARSQGLAEPSALRGQQLLPAGGDTWTSPRSEINPLNYTHNSQLKTSSQDSQAVLQTRTLWIPAPRTEQQRSQPGEPDASARRKCSLYASCKQQLQSAQNQFCAINKTAPNDVRHFLNVYLKECCFPKNVSIYTYIYTYIRLIGFEVLKAVFRLPFTSTHQPNQILGDNPDLQTLPWFWSQPHTTEF